MDFILLIDDNKTVSKLVAARIEEETEMRVTVAASLAEGKQKINEEKPLLVITGLVLPDATNGEMVDYCLENSLPVIVLTSTYDDETRKHILSRDVVDYIIERDQDYIDYLLASVKRALQNRMVKVLVVDDSLIYRKLLHARIASQLFQVFEAENGKQALEMFRQHEDILMVITDFDMPEMDGFELMRELRKMKRIDELAILVVSGENDRDVVPKFLKFGANDYLEKPFNHEEFICRIHLNIDNVRMIQQIRQVSHIDLKTGLFNRNYFLTVGKLLHSNALRNKFKIAVSLVRIHEWGKIVNEAGEAGSGSLIKEIVKIFESKLRRRSDVITLFGQGVLALVTDNSDGEDIRQFYDTIMKTVMQTRFKVKAHELNVRLSAGINLRLAEDFDEMIRHAESLLEKAAQDESQNIRLEE